MSRCDNCKKKFTCKRSKYYKKLNGEREVVEKENPVFINSLFFLITHLPFPLQNLN